MKRLLQSKLGLTTLVLVVLVLALVFREVTMRALQRKKSDTQQSIPSSKPVSIQPTGEQSPETITERPTPKPETLSKDLLFLDKAKALAEQSKTNRDRRGRNITKRKTPAPLDSLPTTAKIPTEPITEPKAQPLALRLKGNAKFNGSNLPADKPPTYASESQEAQSKAVAEAFCPYGRPIKCELVFTIDSTMDETPFVGLVMEPVYNNGHLVIPAGAELHGMARPDRLRDRIFSAQDWVLLFPRDHEKPNGRQLKLKGLALDRAEPASNGLNWGITDGSTGLQGAVIRTMRNEEILQFVATFLSASALGLQDRQGGSLVRGGNQVLPSARNALLQGAGGTLEELARKISAEIERNGVFIRVPGGKQFYFYPQEPIFPAAALVPSSVKT